MEEKGISVYGAHWCPDCRRCKQFLGEHQIPYHWIDIEKDPEGYQFVLDKNNGKRLIPMIVFSDGSFLVDPGNAALATKLGLRTKAARSHYDLIVIGGGPAGISAAIEVLAGGVDVLLIDRITFGLGNDSALSKGVFAGPAADNSSDRHVEDVRIWKGLNRLSIVCLVSREKTDSVRFLRPMGPAGKQGMPDSERFPEQNDRDLPMSTCITRDHFEGTVGVRSVPIQTFSR